MKCDTPFWVLPKAATEKVPVPCGRCPPCKLRRVNSWVFRLLQEDKRSVASAFVTLTYDTRFVPISPNGFMTLCKSDVQKFFKRLRKLVPDAKIKYYAVGEYGSKNSRPHYHAIIFGVKDYSLFADAWSLDGVPIGAVHVGTVSGDSIAYTMKYIDKAGFQRKFARDDRVPEFPLMSKGLGDNYINDAVVKYHKDDLSRLYVTKEGGNRCALPRYYRYKIYSEDEMRQQRFVVQTAVDQSEARSRREWERLYVNVDGTFEFSFEAWKDSQRFGRHSKFKQSLINSRNKL